jgi:hypothetical protein
VAAQAGKADSFSYMSKSAETKKQAAKALIELVVAASSTSTFEDCFDFLDRRIEQAASEVMEAIFDD